MADESASPSSPPLSNRLSITALAISLVALVIGISSFLQAILGTAEGYRRCAYSVIGPWSKLRRRVFKWSEFRFETKFKAPLIQLLTLEELESAYNGEYAGNMFLLNDKDQAKPHRTWKAWLLQQHDPADILDQALHFFDHEHEHPRPPADLTSSKILLDDALGDGLASLRKTDNAQASKPRAPDTLLVSWIRLMHELHVVGDQYWPNEAHGEKASEQFHSRLVASLTKTVVQEFYGRQWASSPRTYIAIVIQEWTWDFMPSDVARPLASASLGHVIIFALRLGMQWRTLDRTRSQLSADGNGRSITSTDVRGLGMVLRFSTNGHFHSENLDLIPSRATDKLMCGIIPGDADLVRRDFPLIKADRKRIELWEPQGVYSQLGLSMPESLTSSLYDRCTHNDVVTLLCSFLPLPGSQLRGFLFSGWKRRQYSSFHFYEPRLRLLVVLSGMQNRSEAMEKVYQALDRLSTRYKSEYYGGYVQDEFAVERSPERELEVTELCAEIFRETTRYFLQEKYDVQPERAYSTWYMQLVAAHARLSAHVEKGIGDRKALSEADFSTDIVDLLSNQGIKSTYFALPLWDQTQGYIDGLGNQEYGVVQYMQSRGFKGDAQKIRDAWWMLMLRGIVWDMSCEGRAYPGEPVVSSYFSDETPVWFT